MGENINLAFQGVWSHKLRSFLTMLGIIIGIAAIITIVSTIQGTNEQIKQNLIGAGNNVVRVQLMQDNYEADLGYSALPDGIQPITRDMRSEMEKLDCVDTVSLFYQRSWSEGVFVGNTAFSGSLYGVDENLHRYLHPGNQDLRLDHQRERLQLRAGPADLYRQADQSRNRSRHLRCGRSEWRKNAL